MEKLILVFTAIMMFGCDSLEPRKNEVLKTRCINGNLYGVEEVDIPNITRLAIFPLFDDDGRPTRCMEIRDMVD